MTSWHAVGPRRWVNPRGPRPQTPEPPPSLLFFDSMLMTLHQFYTLRQATSEAPTPFRSALHDFARRGWTVPAKGWDVVGPDHPFLSVRIQVPLRLCLAVALPPKPLAECLFGCNTLCARRCLLRVIWYAMSGFTLPCTLLYTTGDDDVLHQLRHGRQAG
jgi:hypothetical protein